jgi:hypothetical protein
VSFTFIGLSSIASAISSGHLHREQVVLALINTHRLRQFEAQQMKPGNQRIEADFSGIITKAGFTRYVSLIIMAEVNLTVIMH